MKFVLTMLLVLDSGSVSLATAEFESKAACQAAASTFKELGTMTEREITSFGAHSQRFTRCISKSTGK